jgi:hypothetical protein
MPEYEQNSKNDSWVLPYQGVGYETLGPDISEKPKAQAILDSSSQNIYLRKTEYDAFERHMLEIDTMK